MIFIESQTKKYTLSAIHMCSVGYVLSTNKKLQEDSIKHILLFSPMSNTWFFVNNATTPGVWT